MQYQVYNRIVKDKEDTEPSSPTTWKREREREREMNFIKIKKNFANTRNNVDTL
jgi:hypothetical protein